MQDLEAAKQRAMPYDKIARELREIRTDTVQLVHKAVAQKVGAMCW